VIAVTLPRNKKPCDQKDRRAYEETWYFFYRSQPETAEAIFQDFKACVEMDLLHFKADQARSGNNFRTLVR
jgi:hypothetical protein